MSGTWVEQLHELLGIHSIILQRKKNTFCLTEDFKRKPLGVKENEKVLLDQQPHQMSSELSFDHQVRQELP